MILYHKTTIYKFIINQKKKNDINLTKKPKI